MESIDLNCDMGESYGAWSMGRDRDILPLVSSANIACGFHAGDPTTIRETVAIAIDTGTAVGAHPSYPDIQGFGRREMSLSAREIHDSVVYQVAALKGICESLGGRLHHVKPHGALYNRAARDAEAASAISEAVSAIDGGLFVYGLAGSYLVSEGEKVGLRTTSEVFADRTYLNHGSLTPRSRPDALVESVEEAADRALKMAVEGTVASVEGSEILVRAETICIHGDGPNALEFAKAIRRSLDGNGIEVKAP
ncbi:MAG: LamB/YcsF family protein [Acidobacteria bacterium]|nr:MAG: LamB/YcsF family protein [Acidobacteriota bacterium]REK01638.1 MAG: LamB/YcsF family protein [Acidobacteriota bacterium]REK14594.1 MAG: LamB/YcsF family protein [Acidobacteriota bacterium]REK45309.1 MAG: LamB/YcsF family protein [Acidobacteriota bacterium]